MSVQVGYVRCQETDKFRGLASQPHVLEITDVVIMVTEISLLEAYKDLKNGFRELLLASIARGSTSQTTGYP